MRLIGYEENDPLLADLDFHRKFLKVESLKNIARCIWFVYRCLSQILSTAKRKRTLLRQHKEKLVQVIERISPMLGVKRACRLMMTSAQQFYKWKREKSCAASISRLCVSRFPNQLSPSEIIIVKHHLRDPAAQHWRLIWIYYKMMRDGAAFMGKETFYRCARALGISRQSKRKQKPRTGIRSTAPLKLLHIDVTVYRPADNTRVFIQLITDNFSRAILGWRAARSWSAKETLANLVAVCEKYNLYCKPIQLMCDNGSENAGALNLFLEQPHVNIEKLVAQVDVTFSNSMAEAANKSLKYNNLFTRKLQSFEETLRYLPQAIDELNNRFHYSLYGLTPNEVLHGAVPDKSFLSRHREGNNNGFGFSKPLLLVLRGSCIAMRASIFC